MALTHNINSQPNSSTDPGDPFKPPVSPTVAVNRLADILKFTAVIAIMAIAFYFVAKKLKHENVSYKDVVQGFKDLPVVNIVVAIGLVVLNYFVLTGYDWIAVRHLKKELPLSKIMAGAVVGYASGNVLGWLFGGNAVRYRVYSTWGFTLVEIIAFVSILSITFWLGLFLLAGIAFVALPIKLPPDVLEDLIFAPHVWGIIFLACVGAYLLASIVFRKPIRFREYELSLPPFRLSVMQLVVSAGDFLLATMVLYWLLPPGSVGPDKINFSTVLIAYLTAQILAVLTHVPGGYGILEGILFHFLEGDKAQVVVAVIMFRIVYYILPFIVAGLIFGYNEYLVSSRRTDQIEET